MILLLVLLGLAAVGVLSYFTMPVSTVHDCSKCGGVVIWDIPHTCKPLTKEQVKEIVEEVIEKKSGFHKYDSEGNYQDRE